MDEDSARRLMQETIEKSRLETWGAAFFSTGIHGLLVYGLFFREEVTLAWIWRILAAMFFALIPAVAIRNALVNGSFVLGLSKQGLFYKLKGTRSGYVLCPWSHVVSVRHHQDGQNDHVVLGLKGSIAEPMTKPVNGRIEHEEGVRSLFMDSRSRRRASKIIAVIEGFRKN